MAVSSPEIVERADGRDLGVTIFWPESDAKRSAVILLHGGGGRMVIATIRTAMHIVCASVDSWRLRRNTG